MYVKVESLPKGNCYLHIIFIPTVTVKLFEIITLQKYHTSLFWCTSNFLKTVQTLDHPLSISICDIKKKHPFSTTLFRPLSVFKTIESIKYKGKKTRHAAVCVIGP